MNLPLHNCPNPIPLQARKNVKAQMRGYSDGCKRVPVLNPYPQPSDEAISWQRGFEAARRTFQLHDMDSTAAPVMFFEYVHGG